MRQLNSPNGKYKLFFDLEKTRRGINCPVYWIEYEDKLIIDKSSLGMATKLNNSGMTSDNGNLTSRFIEENFTTDSYSSIWKPVYGERTEIVDEYNKMEINLYHKNTDINLLLEFRAYNEGVAFRYIINSAGEDNTDRLKILEELTQFKFIEDYACWATYEAQGKYTKVRISQIGRECERPLTIQINDNLYAAILEAGLVDYARMKLRINYESKYCLSSCLSGEVQGFFPFKTPWRVIMVAHSPGELIENNYIVQNLNDPCAIKDTSWIKPGTVIREVTLSTQGGLACMDFASKHGISYIMFDAGWYGNEYDEASDASFVSVDPNRKIENLELDLQRVIDYGKEKGIGVILYVNRRALEKQLDEILPIYKKWGVKGIKFGFVNVGSQCWTTWLHEAIKKVAEYEMVVDIHDEYRPTGYSRTYPHLMTQEGICGDEEVQDNSNTLISVFTRLICGASDNTVCYFDKRVDQKNSHAYQLAKSIILYSPLQFLYWYDYPMESIKNIKRFQKINRRIEEVPELEFFDKLPTVWDKTRFLQSKIGEYAAVARRSKDNWFIGIMNSEIQDRSFDISFNFLDEGCKYIANIYSDDSTINTRTKVRIDRILVNKNYTHKASIAKKQGQSIYIEKISN